MQTLLVFMTILNLVCNRLNNNMKEPNIQKVYKRMEISDGKSSYLILTNESNNTGIEFIDFCRDGYYFYNKADILERGLTDSCAKEYKGVYFRMRAKGSITNEYLGFIITSKDSIDYSSEPDQFYQKKGEKKSGFINGRKDFLLPIYFHGTIGNDTIKLSRVYDFYGNKSDNMGTYILYKDPFPAKK